MASLHETLHHLRKDISGETDKALQSAVAAAWPGLSVKSLIAVSGRNGSVDYIHPILGDVIANHAFQRARTETIQHRNRWGYGYVEHNEKPGNFNYRIYAPGGHVASTIKGLFISLSSTESLPYVTEIKDFFPPAAHRSNSRVEHDEAVKYKIAKNRGKVRYAKQYQRELCDAENEGSQHREWKKGFVLRSSISHAAPDSGPNSDHVNGHANHSPDPSANGHAHRPHHLNAPKGRTRRERTYKAIAIKDVSYVKALLGTYELENRSTKDRINSTDGTYTVLQFAGDVYAATHYTADGGRIKLTTYNDEGTALKELGASSRSYTPRKMKRPYPNASFQKQQLLRMAQLGDIQFDTLPEFPVTLAATNSLRSLSGFLPRRPPEDNWTNYPTPKGS